MDNLLSRILEQVHRQPERTAIIMQQAGQADTAISYAQLLRGAAGVAAMLQQQAIRAGEVVILVQQHGLGLVNSFFGAMLHGAIPAIMPFLTSKLSPEKYQADISLADDHYAAGGDPHRDGVSGADAGFVRRAKLGAGGD